MDIVFGSLSKAELVKTLIDSMRPLQRHPDISYIQPLVPIQASLFFSFFSPPQ